MADMIVTTPGRTRLRRLRRTKVLRNLVAETAVGAEHLIMPHFVVPAKRANEPISSMPGIAQMGLRRSHLLPELTTLNELGIRDAEIGGWYGLYAPAKTPAPILDKLNAEMIMIINDPEVKERLATLAFTPVGDSRAQFAAFIKAEIAKWGKAVRDSGAKAD